MNRTVTITVLLTTLLLLNGCRTYFGYESTYQEEDIPKSNKLLSSELESYRIDLKGNQIDVIANYNEVYSKEVASVENREHIYVKPNIPEARVILFPIVVFDIFGCLTNWHLATNPPSTSFLYAPPFSWFTPGIVPPYWLPDPAKLKPGKNITTHKSEDGQTYQSVIEKIIEPEKIELSRRIVQYSKNKAAQETEGTIELQIEGHEYKLPLSNPILTPELFQTALVPARDVKIEATYKGTSASFNISTADVVAPAEQLQIGKDYLNKQNSEQAELWLHRSADNGNTESQYLYGKMLMDKNCTQALRYIQLAVDQNYPEALVAIGKAYFNGWGVKVNKERAVEYLNKAYEMHCPAADVPLAIMYLQGEKTLRDKGLSILRQACDNGNSQACLALGSEYISGKYVATDYQEGAAYILKSAKMGNCHAQYIVGTLYLYGIGLHQDSARAVHWLEIAAEQNGTENNCKLGEAKSKLQAEQQAIRERQNIEKDFQHFLEVNDINIEIVKNYVLLMDQSRTIEAAFSAQLDNMRWRKFADEDNHIIVEVVGIWNNDSLNYERLQQSGLIFGMPNALFPQRGDEVMAQFTVNPGFPSVSFFKGEIRNKNGIIKRTIILGLYCQNVQYDSNDIIKEIDIDGESLASTALDGSMTDITFLMTLYGDIEDNVKCHEREASEIARLNAIHEEVMKKGK